MPYYPKEKPEVGETVTVFCDGEERELTYIGGEFISFCGGNISLGSAIEVTWQRNPKIPFKWEEIWNHVTPGLGDTGTFRAKVKGGWIVKNGTAVMMPRRGVSMAESMVFVPDANHSWVIG